MFAAPVTIYEFDSKEKEAVFYKLTEEVRCLVCQNQTIAESNSALAQDLKKKIYEMLQQDKSEDEIVEFMIERYGDYVMFNPPFKPLTWALWFGPLVVFIVAVFMALKVVASQNKTKVVKAEYSTDEASRLDNLKSEIQTIKDKGNK